MFLVISVAAAVLVGFAIVGWLLPTRESVPDEQSADEADDDTPAHSVYGPSSMFDPYNPVGFYSPISPLSTIYPNSPNNLFHPHQPF